MPGSVQLFMPGVWAVSSCWPFGKGSLHQYVGHRAWAIMPLLIIGRGVIAPIRGPSRHCRSSGRGSSHPDAGHRAIAGHRAGGHRTQKLLIVPLLVSGPGVIAPMRVGHRATTGHWAGGRPDSVVVLFGYRLGLAMLCRRSVPVPGTVG
jgi:hypothetical protein